MTDFRKLAVLAAKNAGKAILELADQEIQYEMKNAHDILAEADLVSEKIIIDEIRTHFPKHEILSEEAGMQETSSDYLWVVDPVDGTINYARGIEEYCISIALVYQSEVILGIIYQPKLGKMFIAEKGKGAELNGSVLKVSQVAALINGLLATDLTSDIQKREDTFNILISLKDKVRHVRIFGSSALHLGRLAEGQLDVYFKNRFKYWDYAAGILIVEESGGKVTDFEGNPIGMSSESIVASNGLLHDDLLNLLRNDR